MLPQVIGNSYDLAFLFSRFSISVTEPPAGFDQPGFAGITFNLPAQISDIQPNDIG